MNSYVLMYEFISGGAGYMNSYFLMYEFISASAMCEVLPSLWHQLG